MLELLAPAGSMEALRAAVQNGANAVYLGVGAFNARQSAKNFTPQSLVEAVKYCHVRGVQVHLTLNTLISDREMKEAAEILNADIEIKRSDFDLIDMCGPGYAIASEEGNKAVSMMAEKEGIFLDPVYTGKAFAGLIQMAKEGKFKKDEKILFLHSGGAGGLFAIDMENGK